MSIKKTADFADRKIKALSGRQRIETPLAIYVGGDEGDMVDDALTFFKNRKNAKLPVEFYVALHENHASVIPTILSRALRFASQS